MIIWLWPKLGAFRYAGSRLFSCDILHGRIRHSVARDTPARNLGRDGIHRVRCNPVG